MPQQRRQQRFGPLWLWWRDLIRQRDGAGRQQRPPRRSSLRRPPPWLGNLLVFGLLIALTVAAFFLQTRAAERRFIADAAEHSRLLADAVRLYARGAVLAGEASDTILTAFLGNSARFVLYLDDIEPFTADELTAFAAESGLALIRILRSASPADGGVPPAPSGDWVQGPPDRAGDRPLPCEPLEQLRRWPGEAGFVFSVPRDGRPGCVMVALESAAVEALRQAVSVQQALQSVGQLPGVLGVRLDGQPRLDSGSRTDLAAHIRLIKTAAGTTLAEAHAPIAGAELVLRLDGQALSQRREELWLSFGVFLLVLLGAGALGTWLLVRVQRAHEAELRDYERRLSAQREEASLGRAAATIAHEIRNPLNAIGLGLQRLKLEAKGLGAAQQALIGRVMQALERTNGTVSALLAYARPGQRERQPLDLVALVTDALAWHRELLDERDADITATLPANAWTRGDSEQLRRALDNLFGNAREALPVGGRLEIALAWEENEPAGSGWRLSVTNDGLQSTDQPLEQLLEPWVTHKTDGTGLGLAIVQRIAKAHDGCVALDSPAPGRLRVCLWLPAAEVAA
ncbi:hypothetical protein CCR91_10705 [Thiorhodovibrio winogradskyi]|nr:hypothetical protein [Thiorhodovibrio winogradskyi]